MSGAKLEIDCLGRLRREILDDLAHAFEIVGVDEVVTVHTDEFRSVAPQDAFYAGAHVRDFSFRRRNRNDVAAFLDEGAKARLMDELLTLGTLPFRHLIDEGRIGFGKLGRPLLHAPLQVPVRRSKELIGPLALGDVFVNRYPNPPCSG